jgi:hypothetical protein
VTHSLWILSVGAESGSGSFVDGREPARWAGAVSDQPGRVISARFSVVGRKTTGVNLATASRAWSGPVARQGDDHRSPNSETSWGTRLYEDKRRDHENAKMGRVGLRPGGQGGVGFVVSPFRAFVIDLRCILSDGRRDGLGRS